MTKSINFTVLEAQLLSLSQLLRPSTCKKARYFVALLVTDESIAGAAPITKDGKYAFYKPCDLDMIEWVQGSGREKLIAHRQDKSTWALTYTGNATFEDPYYFALVQAVPHLNTCATILASLMVASRYISKNASTRKRRALLWANQLLLSSSPEEAFNRLDGEATRALQSIPPKYLLHGFQILQSHRSNLRSA